MKFSLLLLAVVVGLASCASPEQRALRQSYLDEFRSYQLPRQLMSQIANDDPISPDDIVTLSQRRVPPGLIVSYLERVPQGYRLSLADINRLRAVGVSDRVIDRMLATPRSESGPYGETTISYGFGGHF